MLSLIELSKIQELVAQLRAQQAILARIRSEQDAISASVLVDKVEILAGIPVPTTVNLIQLYLNRNPDFIRGLLNGAETQAQIDAEKTLGELRALGVDPLA